MSSSWERRLRPLHLRASGYFSGLRVEGYQSIIDRCGKGIILPDEIGCTATHVQFGQGLCSVNTWEAHMALAVTAPRGHGYLVHWPKLNIGSSASDVIKEDDFLTTPVSIIDWYPRLVLKCQKELERLSNAHQVNLMWVPGNEYAHKLGERGSRLLQTRPYHGPSAPVCHEEGARLDEPKTLKMLECGAWPMASWALISGPECWRGSRMIAGWRYRCQEQLRVSELAQ